MLQSVIQALNTTISGIGFTDVIDIAIIAFVVYQLLGYIKTSRAEQLAKGLLIVIVLFLISDVCHFYAVNWVISKILDVGIIALVVVFQPELRRALEYIGRGKFANKIMGRESGEDNATGIAGAIVKAIEYFSSIKEGSLIVIEREIALSDVVESGTVLDAAISSELLENIFYVGSPLHDGAVIIRGNRVYAAGCMLPLTENKNLSKDLGTRHRAGIGISEVSDALVLIVSEETGIISMAEDGKLSRFLDLKTVEKALLNYYIKGAEPASANPFARRKRDEE